MTALEKAGKAEGLRLYNEYGSPLTIDAAKLALKEQGLTVITERDLRHKVLEEVEDVLQDKDMAEWKERRRVTFRNFHYAQWSMVAVGLMQALLFTVSIWSGDWRWTQTACALVVADVVSVCATSYLWGRIPDKDSKPSVRRHSCYY